jgi:hypothetical protein
MTKATYRRQLKNPLWIVRRCERIILALGMCERCRDTDRINVHHKRYVDGRKAWQYSDDELEVLCRNCHRAEHGILKKSRGASAGYCKVEPNQRCRHEACLMDANHLVVEYKATAETVKKRSESFRLGLIDALGNWMDALGKQAEYKRIFEELVRIGSTVPGYREALQAAIDEAQRSRPTPEQLEQRKVALRERRGSTVLAGARGVGPVVH